MINLNSNLIAQGREIIVKRSKDFKCRGAASAYFDQKNEDEHKNRIRSSTCRIPSTSKADNFEIYQFQNETLSKKNPIKLNATNVYTPEQMRLVEKDQVLARIQQFVTYLFKEYPTLDESGNHKTKEQAELDKIEHEKKAVEKFLQYKYLKTLANFEKIIENQADFITNENINPSLESLEKFLNKIPNTESGIASLPVKRQRKIEKLENSINFLQAEIDSSKLKDARENIVTGLKKLKQNVEARKLVISESNKKICDEVVKEIDSAIKLTEENKHAQIKLELRKLSTIECEREGMKTNFDKDATEIRKNLTMVKQLETYPETLRIKLDELRQIDPFNKLVKSTVKEEPLPEPAPPQFPTQIKEQPIVVSSLPVFPIQTALITNNSTAQTTQLPNNAPTPFVLPLTPPTVEPHIVNSKPPQPPKDAPQVVNDTQVQPPPPATQPPPQERVVNNTQAEPAISVEPQKPLAVEQTTPSAQNNTKKTEEKLTPWGKIKKFFSMIWEKLCCCFTRKPKNDVN